MNIKWDAEKYSTDFSFVHHYGKGLIDLIDAEKNSRVLDLGCGNGALSKALQDRGYRVKGMDASEELLSIARKNYPAIEFVKGDARHFDCSEPYDLVFSNAVFHWIDKESQPDMLQCIRNALKKDGELLFEFGGCGNNQKIHGALERAFSAYGYRYQMPFYFPSVSEYATLLEQNGFRVRYALLFDRPTALKGENGLKDWIEIFVKSPFSMVRSKEEKEAIIDKAAEDLRDELYREGTWYADYVRLRMKAFRL